MGRTRRNYYGPLGAAAFEIYRRWRNSPMANNLPFKYKVGLNVPTQTKTEEEEMVEDDIQGYKRKYVHIHTGNKPLKGMLKGHLLYRDQWNWTQTWNNEYEILLAGPMIGTQSQYLTGTGTSITERNAVSYAPLFDLNPLEGIAATPFVTVALTTAAKDIIGISSGQLYFDFLSACTVPVIVKIHFFVAKTDTEDSPIQTYYDAVLNETVYSTSFVPGTANGAPTFSGNESVQRTTGTTTVPECLNVLPYTNIMSKRMFRSNWRKIKTTSFVLAVGDTQTVIADCVLNQFGMKERLNSMSALYPKGTLACVYEMQSTAVRVAGSAVNTIAGGQIGLVVHRKLHLCPMKAPNARIESTWIGRGTLATGGDISTDKVFSETVASTTMSNLPIV